MKKIFDYFILFLTLLGFGSIFTTILQWSINQWSSRFNFQPVTFWEISSLFVIFFVVLFLYLYINIIKNYKNG